MEILGDRIGLASQELGPLIPSGVEVALSVAGILFVLLTVALVIWLLRRSRK